MELVSNKLLILVTEDWYFMSHRVTLAETAKKLGFQITIVTQISKYASDIKDRGFCLTPIIFSRSLKRPWEDLKCLFSIYKTYKLIEPKIVHHVSIKPILYGSIIQRLLINKRGKTIYINAFTGLGYVFTSDKISAKLVRLILVPLLRFLLKQDNSFFVFQNKDDEKELVRLGIVSEERSFLIPGSGVDTNQYLPSTIPEGIPVCMFVGRILEDKGVEDLIAAIRIIKGKNIKARFILVGEPDIENPAAISAQKLKDWCKEGIIECWGRKDNMPDIYSQSHIVVLPSHREGFPKTIIEASASARPIITTDVPGCRDAIIPGQTGLLVPKKDPDSLAKAMCKLINSRETCIMMGEKGRKLVEEKFSAEVINSQFIGLYNKLINNTNEVM